MLDVGRDEKDITGTARKTFTGADKISLALRHDVKLIRAVGRLRIARRHIISYLQRAMAQHQSG